MSLHRFFATGPVLQDAALPLTASDAHHLRDVLRLGVGQRVVLVEPDASQLIVELTVVGADVFGRVAERLPAIEGPRVTLVQGVGRREAMELVVQKATELGVAAIHPVLTGRSVVKLDEHKRHERGERWRRIAAEAAKQSQRSGVPVVHDPVDLSALDIGAIADILLVPWEQYEGRGIRAALDKAGASGATTVAVVIGPEGGFDTAEVARMREVGGIPVSLGPTILRTETAGIVATALVIYELGGLGGQSRD